MGRPAGTSVEDGSLEIVLSPGGRLRVRAGEASKASWVGRVAAAFELGQGAGLVALSGTRPPAPPGPVVAFWRDVAGMYLSWLCRVPDGAIPPAEAPADEELAGLALKAPPMEGGEYLTARVLRRLWFEIDGRVREEVAEGPGGLAGWFERRAPVWQQVGRVVFHLAENPRDPERPFAFLATYAPRLSRTGNVQHQPLGRALQEYAGARDRAALVRLLSPVERAAGRSALVRALVDSGEIYRAQAWTASQAHRFLHEVPVLEECGIPVRIPDWWRQRPRVRVRVTIGEDRRARLGADALLDFEVGLALGDEALDARERDEVLAAGEGLVRLKGRWVEVDRAKLDQALSHWERVERAVAGDGISFIEGMRLLAGAPADLRGSAGSEDDEVREWSAVGAGAWLAEILAALRDPSRAATGAGKTSLVGRLRPYQEEGHRWLWLLANLGLGACLADDMGLGKTIQVLSVLLALRDAERRRSEPSILVVPASLLANWKREIERFAPSLACRYVHPSETPRADLEAMAAAGKAAFEGADLVLTTYGMLTREEWLAKIPWRLAILDEAQAIKNPGARQTRAVKALRARARIALTGTPIENRLGDLWSLFDFLCPGLLGTAGRFREFVKALEGRPGDRYGPLRALVRPYILRRLKTDEAIAPDLPDKCEVKTYCGLTRRQASLYARSVEELARALEELDGIERRGLVLAYLMRFKQICNHPSQLTGDGEFDLADSGKFERLRAIAEELASRQDKALVFTQFREMTDPIAACLGEVAGTEALVLHGGTPVGRRRSIVDAFQAEGGPPFLVLSLKAGGTGLNLTAANHVIHFDRWWNPAVEDQATDRAFRIGQKRNVLVHKFVCRGTVEERIDALIEEKKGLAGDVLETGGETRLTELSDRELLQVVSLDIDRASLAGGGR